MRDSEDGAIPNDPSSCLIIKDGNAVFHTLKDIPNTFGEISQKILATVVHRSPLVFNIDMYHENSVKGVSEYVILA